MSQNNANRRTHQRVHRDSKHIGSVEAALWRPTTTVEAARAIEAARRYELTHKKKGRRNGPLGGIGLEVYRALWSVVDYSTGRLEPSLEWLMQKTGRCRDAVVTALKRLKRCGFVTWVRRFAYTKGLVRYTHFLEDQAAAAKAEKLGLPKPGRSVPPIAQVTNAYSLAVPADAEAMLPGQTPRTDARASTPADYRLALAQQRERERVAEWAASRPYRADRYTGAPPLSRALKTLNVLLANSESATPEETRPRYLLRDAPYGAGAS